MRQQSPDDLDAKIDNVYNENFLDQSILSPSDLTMKKGTFPLVAALVLNVAILIPVVSGLLFGVPYQTEALGPLTDGCLILTSIYASITIVSTVLVVMHIKRMAWAIPMTVALFSVQITYKLITVLLVGLDNPVVIANVFVVVVQVLALMMLWSSMGKGFLSAKM